MKTKTYNIKNIVLATIFSLMNFCAIFAQIENSKLKDGTVSNGAQKAFPGAIFELESNNKGILTPRLTTGQRDNMTNLTDGLMIYNTTTGCFDYWSAAQNVWLSICGTPPPAEIKIDCPNVKVNGTYKQGTALSSSEFLTLPVTVTQVGTYTISATTPNGYYYNVNGTFPNTGSYTLLIPGIGTPSEGYDAGNTGDIITINVNGKQNTTCQPTNFVEKAAVAFTFVCDNIAPAGDYFIDIPLNDTNKLKVIVLPGSAGYWNISTPKVNGFSFKGSGIFQASEVGAFVTVYLLGSGTPTDSGSTAFEVTSNATPEATCPGVIVNVAPVAYTLNCAGTTSVSTYTQDVALTAESKLNVPITVTATGQTTITTNTVNGMTFSSGVINLTTLGTQTITLVGTGKPLVGETSTFTATGTGKNAAGTQTTITTCNDLKVNLAPQSVNYSITCGSIATTGTFAPGATMDASNTIVLPVNVKYLGNYSITTNVQNGVSFSGSGTFTATGAQNVILTASATKAINGGAFTYTIDGNSTNVGTCSKIIYYAFRTINLYGLGQGPYEPASSGTSNSARALITNTTSFGPTSTKIQVEKINLIDGGCCKSATDLKNDINTKKIDIIVIGYNYNPDAASRAVLASFVKDRKGVLLHSQEYDDAGTKALIDLITGGSSTVRGTGTTPTNPILNVDDPILNGPFGDARGKALGNDVNNAKYITGTIPNTTVLATQLGKPSSVWAFKHNTLGYFFCGDSGWLAGDSGNIDQNTYPCKMSASYEPLPKTFNGGTVYNSTVYTNAIAWAINFAQANTDVNYIIP